MARWSCRRDLRHGDGALGNWQGQGAICADRVNAVIEASGVRTRPLGNAASWLCSDEASMVTGVCMEIDGGRCI